MAKIKGLSGHMHDAWHLTVGKTVHTFHLQNGPQLLPVGHISSEDLIHWRHHPDCLPPMYDDNIPDDYYEKWTGCSYPMPKKDGEKQQYGIFYTMLHKNHNQSIGLALTEDLEALTRYSDKPVLTPDEKLFIGPGNVSEFPGYVVDCRDLLVVYYEEEEIYYGYFATMAHSVRECPVGAVAVARSKDLIHWTDQKIAFLPEINGVYEVPDVFYMDGKWYLTLLSGANYAGRGVTGDPYVRAATIYATADHPAGPFVTQPDNILIGGISSSGYSCRSVVLEGKRYLMYVERPDTGGQLSLPKELRAQDGKLGAYYTPRLESLRIKNLLEGNPALVEAGTSFNWATRGGKAEKTPQGFAVTTRPTDYQAAYFDCPANALEMKAHINVQAEGAGFAFIGDDKVPCFVSVEPARNRILILRDLSFDDICAREIQIPPQGLDLRMIYMDGICEVYVNDKLLIQCPVRMSAPLRPGLFCDRGQMELQNPEIWALEL